MGSVVKVTRVGGGLETQRLPANSLSTLFMQTTQHSIVHSFILLNVIAND